MVFDAIFGLTVCYRHVLSPFHGLMSNDAQVAFCCALIKMTPIMAPPWQPQAQSSNLGPETQK